MAARTACQACATSSTRIVRWANMVRERRSFSLTSSQRPCRSAIMAGSFTKSKPIWRWSIWPPRSSSPFISACTTSLVLAGTGTEMPSE